MNHKFNYRWKLKDTDFTKFSPIGTLRIRENLLNTNWIQHDGRIECGYLNQWILKIIRQEKVLNVENILIIKHKDENRKSY